MYTYNWYQWLAFFYLYCFFGWIFESTYVSLRTGHLVNRGFLRSPLLPLYGSGAVMMLLVSLPVRDYLPLVYLFGVIAATALEYVTGYMMERLFKMRYWDYSNQRFQLHGYICLSSSIAWGFLTIFMTEVIHEPIARAVLGLNQTALLFCVLLLSVLFILDAYESTKEALALGRSLEAITRLKAEADELQARILALREEAAEQVLSVKEEQAERLASARAEVAGQLASVKDAVAGQLAFVKDEVAEQLALVKDEVAGQLASVKDEVAGQLASVKDEVAGQLASVKDEVAGQLASARNGAAKKLAKAHRETQLRLARAKYAAADKLTAVKDETTRKLHVAGSATAFLTAALHSRDAGTPAGDAPDGAGLPAARQEEYENQTAARAAAREEKLAALSGRLEEAQSKRRALQPSGRIRHFYRKGLLKGNPGAVSSRFSEALKEVREELDHTDGEP